MNTDKIATINGKRYDSQTGMPIDSPRVALTAKKPTSAARIHGAPQKSQTLVRRATKKPTTAPLGRPSRVLGRTMDIARSGKISRFAPHPVIQTPSNTQSKDIPASTHPAVRKVNKLNATKQAASTPRPSKSSKDIKQEAIEAAMAKPSSKEAKKSFFKHHPRFVSVFSIGILVALLGAYLTYVNMPNLSVRVAATQAGIAATYPEYRPDGYRIDGPVTFSDGQVTINFAANTGSSKFIVQQSKSAWDSSAVLDNIVRKNVGEKYITSQERGLTIYTYSGNAAWVNAGILYTIEGDAPLSVEQIRRIATSL
ncbi:hypothetical protein H7X68_01870 [Candidatus Saccharibacteria bacterium]|nr:hypothetical protein [Candidatus Saccharibacteria bacterium]